MSSSDRRGLITGLAGLVAAFGLAACGFAPAYGPGGAAEGLLDRVDVEAPVNRNEFELVERLEERLGRSREPAYRLSYSVATRALGLGITPDNVVSRFQLTGTVDFRLTDAATGAVLAEGEVTGFTAYSASGTTVSTVSSERDAHRRLMRLLADQLVTRLIAASGGWNGR